MNLVSTPFDTAIFPSLFLSFTITDASIVQFVAYLDVFSAYESARVYGRATDVQYRKAMNGIHLVLMMLEWSIFVYVLYTCRTRFYFYSFFHLPTATTCGFTVFAIVNLFLFVFAKDERVVEEGMHPWTDLNSLVKFNLIGSDLTRNKINNQSFFLPHCCAVSYSCTRVYVHIHW